MSGGFGELIQQAAKMKGAQMAKDKRRFETWPKYLQHTMYNQEKLSETRALPDEERLAEAAKMKAEGNDLLKQQQYQDAMNVYEKALGIYYYVHNRESDWKKKGINDADVKIVDETLAASGDEMAAQVAQLKLSVLLNISLTAENMADHGLSARACSDALNIDSGNHKALWRRSTAYYAMGSALEFDMAIEDMATSHGLDESNEKVTKRLKKWKAERKKQKGFETKTFGGMFERGSMTVEEVGAAAGGGQVGAAAGGGGGQFERYSSMAELEADVAKMKDAISAAEYNNNKAEAKLLKQRLQKVEDWVATAREKAMAEARKKAMPDWSNPSEKEIEEAKEHGLDLTDPDVQAELARLSREKAGDGDGDDPIAEGATETPKNGGMTPWKVGVLVAMMVMAFRVMQHSYVIYTNYRSPADPNSVESAAQFLDETGGVDLDLDGLDGLDGLDEL